MAKATKKSKTKPIKLSKPVSQKSKTTDKPRRLKRPNYKSFRLSQRIKPVQPKLPSALHLFRQSLVLLKKHWKLFLGISLVYGLLTLVLVRGFSAGQTDFGNVKTSLKDTFTGHFSTLSTSAVLFSYLIGSGSGSSTATGGVYQALLVITVSLATIWALRQVLADAGARVRDSFYKGLYPLVPFILVLLVIGLQLIPLLVGSWLYSTVISNGIAVSLLEKVMWGIFFLLSSLLSLYMICSSLFALYIVTLPDMTPMKALRSARQLVLHRRWLVLRKILFLPLILLVLGAIIFMPLVIIAASMVQWIFFVISIFALVVAHSYMYNLYRSLL